MIPFPADHPFEDKGVPPGIRKCKGVDVQRCGCVKVWMCKGVEV
jgi:hypothetical protein